MLLLGLALLAACGGPAALGDGEEEPERRGQAVQSAPVSRFDGAYDLTCGEVRADLYAAVNNQVVRLALPLPCAVPDAAQQGAFRQRLQATCQGLGLPAPGCATLAQQATAALVGAIAGFVGGLPQSFDLTVQSGNGFGRWTGLYPANLALHARNGQRANLSVWIDNNDSAAGHLFAAGLQPLGGGGGQGLACLAFGAGSLDGGIGPGGAVALDLAASLQGACLAQVGPSTALLGLGGSLTVHSLGQRRP